MPWSVLLAYLDHKVVFRYGFKCFVAIFHIFKELIYLSSVCIFFCLMCFLSQRFTFEIFIRFFTAFVVVLYSASCFRKSQRWLKCWLTHLLPTHTYSIPWKHQQNLRFFWCFQGVEKRYIGNKWVKFVIIFPYFVATVLIDQRK